jgi:hypothetical protein
MLNNTEGKLDSLDKEQKTTAELLVDAHNEIEDLKSQIAWLERSYE